MLTGFPTVRPGRPDVSIILPELLVGEYPNPDDVEWLRATHGVTAIFSLQDHADLASKNLRLRDVELACQTHGVAFHNTPLADGDVAALAAALPALVDRLIELLAGGARVYLHCNAGLNRAPTVAIALLHRRDRLSLAAARDFVRSRRVCGPYMTALEACWGEPRDTE